jgi:hypothetical protein
MRGTPNSEVWFRTRTNWKRFGMIAIEDLNEKPYVHRKRCMPFCGARYEWSGG